MKINHCDKYIFSFLDKQNPLNNKSTKFLNCAFDKGDSDYIVRNNRKLVSKLFNNKEIIFVNQIHSSKIFIFSILMVLGVIVYGLFNSNLTDLIRCNEHSIRAFAKENITLFYLSRAV